MVTYDDRVYNGGLWEDNSTYLIILFTKTIDEALTREWRLFTTASTIIGYKLEEKDKESNKEIKCQWSRANDNDMARARWLRIKWPEGLDDTIEGLWRDIMSSYGHHHPQPPHLWY